MAGRLAGKTAFVTAAAQGFGRTTALAFPAEGARVTATDLDAAKVGEIASGAIRDLAGGVADINGDARAPAPLRKLAKFDPTSLPRFPARSARTAIPRR